MIKNFFLFLIFMCAGMLVKGSQAPGSPERGTLKKKAVQLAISDAHAISNSQAQLQTTEADTQPSKPKQINMTRRVKMIHRRDEGSDSCKMLCCLAVGCCCSCILK